MDRPDRGRRDDGREARRRIPRRRTRNVTINTSAGAATTDDLLTKLSAGFTSGTYPDISYAYGSWAGELAASGNTQDLT